MAAPDPGKGRCPHRVTQLNCDMHPARWPESSVKLHVKFRGFGRRVGDGHRKTIPRRRGAKGTRPGACSFMLGRLATSAKGSTAPKSDGRHMTG